LGKGSGSGFCGGFEFAWMSEADIAMGLGIGAEDWADIIGDVDFFLAGSAGELVGFKLAEDFLEREFDEGVIAVSCIGEDAGRRGFTDVAEADFDAALGELGEDLLERDGDAGAAAWGLADFAFEGIGEFKEDGAEGDGDGACGGRRSFMDELCAAVLLGEVGGGCGSGGEIWGSGRLEWWGGVTFTEQPLETIKHG
jgi:hypothetical protein